MITTVVFDLDDTLYDELDYCRSGMAAVAAFLSQRPGSPASDQIYAVLWDVFIHEDRRRTFNIALERLGLPYDQTLIAELVRVYRNHKPQLTLPQETHQVLEASASEYDLALLTDGFLPAQKYKVEALGIAHRFEPIVYTEELGREFWKPSPVGFEKILAHLHAEPHQAVYVADNPIKDFIAPNQLGFATIRVRRPNRIHSADVNQADARAKYEIRTLGDLPCLLQRISRETE